MKKSQRTDEHRPGAIVPARYTHWNSYSLASSSGGFAMPSIGVDCAQPYPIYTYDAKTDRSVVTGYEHPVCPDSGRCCVRSTHRHAEAEGRAIFGNAGKCGVCGACFVYGSMFRHENGEIVHMGHDCADKYEAMYDLSAWEVQRNRQEKALATAITAAKNEAERASFLDKFPGLAEDLALATSKDLPQTKGAGILVDIARKFVTYRSLSPKQVEFVAKLANEIRNPPAPKAEETKVEAPTGKGVEFEGEIVSVKNVEGQWGWSTKVTVKVMRPDGAGIWLAWGTLPANMCDLFSGNTQSLKGVRVAVKATLEASKGSERSCEYCGGSGKCEESDYARNDSQTGRQYKAVTRIVTCTGCSGTGTVGRKADGSFAFMKRPTMTLAGSCDVTRPVVKKARKPKSPRECRS